ncbi:MAG: DegV family EDD domain-containing protein [Candidatus Aminicenantes bacterium]|nr:DegV family EDD domain-containing protein [Candidatus Aminicenantes bacterium]
MKIRYLNGSRLYFAILAGGNAVIEDQSYLNKINVFPVPDADTGTNLASTMRAIADGAEPHHSIKATLKSVANAALSGARGNSGLIFAQFIHGMSKEISHESRLTTHAFAESVKRAVHYAHKAIVHPVEGTMITVIREWAEAVYQRRSQTSDFVELMTESLHTARNSLKETTQKLQVLARAGVVDAGAKGFVDFLEGILNYIKKGKLARPQKAEVLWAQEEITVPAKDKSLEYRYCSEALLTGSDLDPDAIRSVVRRFGESAVVAGSEEKVRIHVHTNRPAELFFELKDHGLMSQIKVDDMRRQYEAAHERKSRIAIVTDSACDLPPEVLDERQIHVIPLTLSFGDQQFLDKLTIRPDQFYGLLETSPVHPKTAVPPVMTAQNLLSFLASHYDSIIVITLSDKLSGVYNMCLKAAAHIQGKTVSVIDSRAISAVTGLLVAKASDMAEAGATHDEIVRAIETAVPRTQLLVDVATMKYFVRSGRVSPVKGLIGRLLKVKPIITLDETGKAAEGGKSFSRKANMAKILAQVRKKAAEGELEGYAVVHARNPERAALYEKRLTELLGREPAFIMDVAPVIGVHAGVGTVGVALLYK